MENELGVGGGQKAAVRQLVQSGGGGGVRRWIIDRGVDQKRGRGCLSGISEEWGGAIGSATAGRGRNAGAAGGTSAAAGASNLLLRRGGQQAAPGPAPAPDGDLGGAPDAVLLRVGGRGRDGLEVGGVAPRHRCKAWRGCTGGGGRRQVGRVGARQAALQQANPELPLWSMLGRRPAHSARRSSRWWRQCRWTPAPGPCPQMLHDVEGRGGGGAFQALGRNALGATSGAGGGGQRAAGRAGAGGSGCGRRGGGQLAQRRRMVRTLVWVLGHGQDVREAAADGFRGVSAAGAAVRDRCARQAGRQAGGAAGEQARKHSGGGRRTWSIKCSTRMLPRPFFKLTQCCCTSRGR